MTDIIAYVQMDSLRTIQVKIANHAIKDVELAKVTKILAWLALMDQQIFLYAHALTAKNSTQQIQLKNAKIVLTTAQNALGKISALHAMILI
jgi:hypothetical protein